MIKFLYISGNFLINKLVSQKKKKNLVNAIPVLGVGKYIYSCFYSYRDMRVVFFLSWKTKYAQMWQRPRGQMCGTRKCHKATA